MIKKRQLTNKDELNMGFIVENPLTWEQQEVFRLLKSQPGTTYQESDETGRAVFRDWMRGLLDVTEVTVTFVKADGTEREMQCTLNWDLIPTDKQPGKPSVDGHGNVINETKQRKEPDVHTLRVFDVEKQEWRSFRWDSINKIQFSLVGNKK